MAQYPKVESIGSTGSIVLAILEVQTFALKVQLMLQGPGAPLACGLVPKDPKYPARGYLGLLH